MKNWWKIGALSVALIGSLLLLYEPASASHPGIVSFTITWISNTACIYGTSWTTATPLVASYTTQVATAALANFICIDTEGQSGRHMDLLASGNVTNGITNIPATWVSMIASPNIVTSGYCVTWVNTTSLTSIGSTAWTIMKKLGWLNQICTITTASVELQTAVPASATVWVYVGSLILTTPW